MSFESWRESNRLADMREAYNAGYQAGQAAENQKYASEELQRFVIKVEKRLCELLCRVWSPSGMSIETLTDEIAKRMQSAPSQTITMPKPIPDLAVPADWTKAAPSQEPVGTVGQLFDDHVMAKSGLDEDRLVYLIPPDAAAQIAELKAQLLEQTTQKYELIAQIAKLESELDEWRHGERTYPPAKQSYNDMVEFLTSREAGMRIELTDKITKLESENLKLETESVAHLVQIADSIKQIAKLEAALRQIKEGAITQGLHTGMSWKQVQQIAGVALGVPEP